MDDSLRSVVDDDDDDDDYDDDDDVPRYDKNFKRYNCFTKIEL